MSEAHQSSDPSLNNQPPEHSPPSHDTSPARPIGIAGVEARLVLRQGEPVDIGSGRFAIVPYLLDRRQLAAFLGMSPSKIKEMTSTGELPRHLKIGKLVRWRRTEIEAWLDAGLPSRGEWERVRGARWR